jgi:hypothetical protein
MGRPGRLFRQSAQGAAYSMLYARQRRRSRRPVTLLELGGEQTHLTTIARIPASVATPIVELVRRLPGADEHYLYPAADLHLTVLNIEYLAEPENLAAVNAVLAETPSFDVHLRGLGMSSRSIYVQAFDSSGSLSRLRKRLTGLTTSQQPFALQHLGFVNVLRYQTPDVERLRLGVHAARRVPIGTVHVTTVEVVQTDKVLSLAGTTLSSSVWLIDNNS